MKLKIKTFLLTALLAGQFIYVNAQDCVSYFPTKLGATWETKNYDSKDKITSTNKSKIIKSDGNVNNLSASVSYESFDNKNVSQGTGEYVIQCKNGVFVIDMKSMINSKTMETYKDMDVTVSSTDMEMPSNPTVGQTLKDAEVSIKVNGGMAMMNLTIRIFNRKVAAIESVTTPAGTFENCVKITYDVETNMMMKVQTKGIDWYAKNVGPVRTETYDSKDKKMGYSLLTSITQ
jgi:hypothetical protein